MRVATPELIFEVGPAELRVGTGPTILRCRGLGSCVCLTLWDPTAGAGGMAHVVLPDSARYLWEPRPGMFADRAPAALCGTLVELGARRSRLVATVVGGANIFSAAGNNHVPALEIGRRNAEAVAGAVRRLGLRIAVQDVGGTTGRRVDFSLLDGQVVVRSSSGEVRAL